jgi:hypothetical protein
MEFDPRNLDPPRVAPMVASRRGFVGVAASFVAGGVLGVAGGYSTARWVAGAPVPVSRPPDEELPSTGNDELDELRWLAVKAPIEELASKNALLFVQLDRKYRTDPVLWRGVARLCGEALGNEGSPHRRMIALQAVVAIEHDHPPAELRLEELLPRLRTASRR